MRAPQRMPLVAPILAKSTCRRQRDGVSDEVRHPIRSVCLTNCATTPRRSGFCKSLLLSFAPTSTGAAREKVRRHVRPTAATHCLC